MRIKTKGIFLNYEIQGVGPDLVLIHGAGDNLRMWYNQVPVFSKYYRVITYDVRGSGESDSPEEDFSMSLFTEDAYQLMSFLRIEKAFFLGFSMGGHIALRLALEHPEIVKGIILANSSGGLVKPLPGIADEQRLTMEFLNKGDMEKAAEVLVEGSLSAGFRSKNPIQFKKYLSVKKQNKADSIARLFQLLKVSLQPLGLDRLKCPALIIVGENDRYMGVGQGKRVQELLAGAELKSLPTGHASAIELPDLFNSMVLEFLSRIK